MAPDERPRRRRDRIRGPKPPPAGPAGIPLRMARAWRALELDQRIAAGGSLGLLASMFLPWYEKSFFVQVNGQLQGDKQSLSAFGAFSFVEAAVLLVAAALSYLLFARAERRAFHLPFGDGVIIAGSGAWAALLIVIRFFDKPGVNAPGRTAGTVGIQWGAFVALAAAAAIAYAGWRIRMAGRPEPEIRTWSEEPAALEFEPLSPQESPTVRLPPDPPTRRIEASRGRPSRPLADLPDVDAPPEYGSEAEPEPEPDAEPEPTAEQPPPGRTPRRTRPAKPPQGDRLF